MHTHTYLVTFQTTIMNAYECTFCAKKYVRKHAFDKHYLLCKNLSYARTRQDIQPVSTDTTDTTEFEKEVEVPSPLHMYQLLLTVLKRQDDIIQDINKLKRGQDVQMKKLDIVIWLQQTRSLKTTFLSWIDECIDKCISMDKASIILEHIFEEKNIQVGVSDIFTHIFEGQQMSKIPVQCFTHKNELYIHEYFDHVDDKNWMICTNEHLKLCLKKIHTCIIRWFLQWSDQQQNKIMCDLHFYEQIYVPRQNIITNGAIPMTFAKDKIYQLIVQNSNTIVAYTPNTE